VTRGTGDEALETRPPGLRTWQLVHGRDGGETMAEPAVWDEGEIAEVGSRTLVVAEQLCEMADLRPGSRVLDVATGHGNAALAAARRDCVVTAIDSAPSLLARARLRAQAEGLSVDFREADARALPFEDGAFDVVLSTFGVQFVADVERAAAELLRVCRPGGTIALANWSPSRFAAEFGAALDARGPEANLSPFLWGTEVRVRELLGPGVRSLSFRSATFVHRVSSPEAYVERLCRTYGPIKSACARRPEAEREAMIVTLTEAVRRYNRSGDATLLLPLELQEVVAIRG
jgi:SAM-dependent methyltransferase